MKRVAAFLKKLSSRPAFRNISILATGTVIAQLINIVSTPILTRLFNTSDFARLAVFTAIGAIILSFSSFRLHVGIVKSQVNSERLSLVKISFLSNFVVSIVSCGAIYILYLTKVLHFGWYEIYLFIGSLFVYINTIGGNQTLTFFLNSKNIYKPISVQRILHYSGIFVFSLLFYFVYKKNGLILAYISGASLPFLYLAYFFRNQFKRVKAVKTPDLKKAIVENFDFIRYSTPSAFIDVLAVNAVVLFTSVYFSEEITGSYFIAEKIIYLPVTLIAFAIGQVFFKNMSQKHALGKLSTKEFIDLWKILFSIGIFPCLLLYFFGEQIFVFVLGKDWRLAGQIIAIMSFRGFAGFISSPTSSGLVIIEKQSYILLFTLIKITYTLVLLFISWQLNDFFFFVYAYTIAEVLKAILSNFILVKLIEKKGAIDEVVLK